MEKAMAEKLVARAREAQKNAYAPYSHFRVGAALLTSSGKIYQGCNVENLSFGGTICAERTAVCSAVADGALARNEQFLAIAIAGGESFCSPCGICRQFLAEFSKEMQVLCADGTGEYLSYTLEELLPAAFSKLDGRD